MKDDGVDKETIKLYGLNTKGKCFEEKEQEPEDKEEDLSKNKYYKIDDKKREELEKVFKHIKTKIQLNSKSKSKQTRILPEIIYDIKEERKNKKLCIIYDEKYFYKLTEIEIPYFFSILSVEKLDNKDLIFLVSKGKDYELLVYRLMTEEKNEKKGYFLNQRIKETNEGYKIKYYKKRHRYRDEVAEPIEYDLFYIKAISGNRFFCVSNYGFKLYALNEKKEYELVLLEPYEKIDFIYEIDTCKFIFGLNIRRVEGYGFCGNAYTCYYNLLINKIELKDIDKIENKLKQEKSNDCMELINNEKDNLKLKEKLKFSYISQTMFNFNYSIPRKTSILIKFSDFAVIKNKFFIIMINKRILIFNMETGKEIKRFEIECDGGGYEFDIKKWDCIENDEFILIVDNNVILFKLIEENSSKICLNILNYAYFHELCNKDTEDTFIHKDLKKINNQNNRFYTYNNESSDIAIY